jgi:DNA-nicking Smr family endonuclease
VAEIDLHGLRAREATVVLAAFLNRVPRDERAVCVRVIHGKGQRSPQGAVLRPLVAGWLSRRDDVLAFATAPEHEGGSGALYVLLRRT